MPDTPPPSPSPLPHATLPPPHPTPPHPPHPLHPRLPDLVKRLSYRLVAPMTINLFTGFSSSPLTTPPPQLLPYSLFCFFFYFILLLFHSVQARIQGWGCAGPLFWPKFSFNVKLVPPGALGKKKGSAPAVSIKMGSTIPILW